LPGQAGPGAACAHGVFGAHGGRGLFLVLLAAYHVLVGQRLVAFQVAVRLFKVGLVAQIGGPGLLLGKGVGGGVDGEEHLPGLDRAALDKVHFLDVRRKFAAYVHAYGGLDGADGGEHVGHVFKLRLGRNDRRGRGHIAFAPACGQKGGHEHEGDKHGKDSLHWIAPAR